MADAQLQSCKKRRHRPPRPSTNLKRKLEQDQLRAQLQELQSELEMRRHAELSTAWDHNEPSLVRNVMWQQQSVIHSVQNTLHEMNIYLPCGPIAPPIRLGRDPKQRQAKLLALKEPLLERARRYQQTRYGYQSARCNNTEFQLYETDEGDLICTQAATIRVKASVTRTFERVRFVMCSIEIAISEKTGHTAIREEPGAFATEPDESGIVQSRWVMFLPRDLLLEANTVSFSAFHEADPSSGDSEFGIVSMASVEHDELYPYQPLKRAHLEGSSVLTVERDPTDPETTVVKYLAHRKLHRFDPGLQVAPECRSELPAMLDRWCDGIQSIMREDVLMLARETECRERMEKYGR